MKEFLCHFVTVDKTWSQGKVKEVEFFDYLEEDKKSSGEYYLQLLEMFDIDLTAFG